MTPEEKLLFEQRRSDFSRFYEELIPALVDFVDRLGIEPPYEVLNHAVEFAPLMEAALSDMNVDDDDEGRIWLLTRVAYFIGEYFVQKYRGSWHVSEAANSKYFGRYVIGKFTIEARNTAIVDPFEVSKSFISEVAPRKLRKMLEIIEVEIEKI